MFESSQVELSKKALENNLAFLRNYLGEGVKISSVVKGNAYGHGLVPFVKMAHACGIEHFSVFSTDEARTVHDTLPPAVTIVVMGLAEKQALHWAIDNGVEFFVFEKDRLLDAVEVSKYLNKPAKIHIELETGMNRTGFSTNDLPETLKILKIESQHLLVKGLCTHYAGAENVSNYQRVRDQITLFKQMTQVLADAGIRPEMLHTACSAASVMFPETRMDMVRIGIMQYGLWPSPETFMHYLDGQSSRRDPLKRVISWKSEVMSVKQVREGDFIGYGTGYMSRQEMKVAVIPVGYAQGFSRSLSNHGRVLMHGRLCPVVGTVNMNMMTIDVTDIPEVQKGDEAVLIGAQDEQQVTVASFSDYSNQLNYELLTRLPPNIPRKIIR